MKAMVVHECDPGLVPLGRAMPGGVSLRPEQARLPAGCWGYLLAARMVFSLAKGYLMKGMRVAGEALKLWG